MNNKAMFKLSYGLFVLTAQDGSKDNGCITNTAIQVTTEPNQISVAVNKLNFTHDMILNTKKFNVSILGEDASFETFKHFGFQSGRNIDKFADYTDMTRSENGIYYITAGTNAFISAEVSKIVDLGTHTLFIASVTDMEVLSDARSATYEYYQSNIKPKPAKQEGTGSGKVVWRCKVCGYIYDPEKGDPAAGFPAGLDLDNLPSGFSFACPLCKHPASDFEKITL